MDDKQKQAFKQFADFSRLQTLFVAFAVIFMLIGTMFWLSDYLEAKLDMAQVLRGVVISLPAIAMLITTLFAGTLAKVFSPKVTMGGGNLLMAVSLFGVYYALDTLLFWIFIVTLGIGAGIVLPAVDMVSTSVEAKEIRGIMSTIYGSARSLGGALSTIVFSNLLSFFNLQIAVFVFSGIGLIIGMTVIFTLQEGKILPKKLLPDK